MSSFISQKLTVIEAVTGCTFACICHTGCRTFSCLQINWQPFYLRQLLKFHPFDGEHSRAYLTSRSYSIQLCNYYTITVFPLFSPRGAYLISNVFEGG